MESLGDDPSLPETSRDSFIGLSRFMGTLCLLTLDHHQLVMVTAPSFHVDNSLPTSLVTFSTQNSPWHLNKEKGDPFMSQFFFLLSNIFVCLLHSQTFLHFTMCLFFPFRVLFKLLSATGTLTDCRALCAHLPWPADPAI